MLQRISGEHLELRLNTSIKPNKYPKRLGVLDGDNAGFPNGRRLTDDVVDEALLVMEGALVGKKNNLSDGVDANDQKFGNYFPYLAEPTSGSRGPVGKGNGNKVRNELTDGLVASSGTDTTLIASSAAGGMAGVLLIGAAVMWWRRRTSRYRAY